MYIIISVCLMKMLVLAVVIDCRPKTKNKRKNSNRGSTCEYAYMDANLHLSVCVHVCVFICMLATTSTHRESLLMTLKSQIMHY